MGYEAISHVLPFIHGQAPNTDLCFFHQVWTAGQVIGLIHDIPSCHDLVTRIEREAEETLNKASSLIIGNHQIPKTATGTVGENMNNPGAEIWGVGKSKL